MSSPKKTLTAYIAGPITGTTASYRQGYFITYAKIMRRMGIKVISPIEQALPGSTPAFKVVESGLGLVRKCDLVLLDGDNHSWGSSMEAFYAWQLNIPVITVISTGTTLSVAARASANAHISPWLRTVTSVFIWRETPMFAKSLREALKLAGLC